MSVGIYKIENKINKKCYIGQSVNIEKRWNKHINAREKYPLYSAFKKYGLENFNFEILEETKIEELNEKEEEYIMKYNSYNNGYNQTLGGQNITFQKLNEGYVDEIILLLQESNLIGLEIAEKFNVGNDFISMINNGKAHRRDISYPIRDRGNGNSESICPKCNNRMSRNSKICKSCYDLSQRRVDRPKKEELLEKIALSGFAQVGREYGVSDNAIRNWCEDYNLPRTKKEMKILFGNTQRKASL